MTDPTLPIVTTALVDVAHWESADVALLERAQNAEAIEALIAKCTQGGPGPNGESGLDSAYDAFHAECDRLKIPFGSFHFGSGTCDGDVQAEHYLKHAGVCLFYALDLEWQTKNKLTGKPLWPEMATPQVETFARRVFDSTGRYPFVYTSLSYLNERGGIAADSVLRLCPLWLCDYVHGLNPPIPHPWTDYVLHQYTNGYANSTHYPTVTPILGKIDRSLYRGDAAALRACLASAGSP